MDLSPQLTNKSGSPITAVLAILMLVLVCGCGPAPEPMGALTGSVKAGEKLIGNCTVTIFNTATGKGKTALADESAKFAFKEIPFGDYQIAVYPIVSEGPNPTVDPRIPKKYRIKKTSGLTFTIDSEDEAVLDIDLK